ncbi:hypothetical protein [Natrononativus amylolyticus]|uniref:hypothetical protein n=1 Tax=Natrononativus amylolyticus TaxID=2963434 RepID=UPI0020CE4C9D|nr:hypothetical protein [Natrononativus amylolyticus]
MSVDADHDTSAAADQEWELQEQLVNEAVRLGLETSFREPILEAVKESGAVETRGASDDTDEPTVGDDGVTEESGSSPVTTVVQGLVVFVVMFVVLYVVLRKLTGGGSE